MKVYHGTDIISAENIIKRGVDFRECADKTDFGKGFYTTPDIEFAFRRSLQKDDENVLVVISFDFDKDRAAEHTLEFIKPDIDWAQFIVANRIGIEYCQAIRYTNHNLFHQYDIVMGQTADSSISTVTRPIKASVRKANENDLKLLTTKVFPLQISFHTELSLQYLSSPEIIKREEG